MATTETVISHPSTFPADYVERVYAGVLGKLIGVYLGRPVEGWTYDRITAAHGEVDRYIHESRGMPLVVTDDDVSGTFTFLRALPDHGKAGMGTPRRARTGIAASRSRRSTFGNSSMPECVRKHLNPSTPAWINGSISETLPGTTPPQNPTSTVSWPAAAEMSQLQGSVALAAVIVCRISL